MLRKQLQTILSLLSRWALKKHQTELIIITGWYGTEIAKEALYTVLSDTYKVRRNTREIWWDLSIPLIILGYQDKRRNILEWIGIIIKAFIYLLFGPSNQHSLIINADSTNPALIEYWSSFIKPDILLILNDDADTPVVRGFLNSVKIEEGIVVYNSDKVSQSLLKTLSRYNTRSFGKDKSDYQISFKNDIVTIKHSGKEEVMFIKNFPVFVRDSIGGLVIISFLKKMSFEEIKHNFLKVELKERFFAKIWQHINI